ncbi:Lrp/AsnC ligand binding domain-containing protein [Haloterrigena sp. SYSU A558-1]|uniref:Lrp/AsnC ligand binding domain-containing protein n=1 Tax=Haloterrigena gelatinilytica TaxID=2741724 RepID=A0A8J8GH66_9EURY|nr:Lrp/AsnC ligand binding domain-containing protein [Haloterrigena gelatinilytica]NUB89914.1 Lrp/AsnC ligand binding domain-containing protein [Haloterrigena gelatinilytica]NUC74261.1 Lrp/AsnC ligand binding domain-containing protein [Haloterrigena gelatinilytica]
MSHAFVMIDVATGMSEAVCESVREVDGVVEAHVVAGDFDVVVELEGERPHDLLSTVTSAVRPLEDVGTTRTYVCLD